MDIGHYGDYREDNPDCDEWLWVFSNGDIEFEEGMPVKNHANIWPSKLLDSTYSGRYDECLNQISIGIPSRGMIAYKNIPSFLPATLKRKFSPSAQVYSFRIQTPEFPTGVERVASSHQRTSNAH